MHGSESQRTPVPHMSDLGPIAAKRPRTETDSTAEAENRRKDPKVSRACDTCKRKKIRCNGTLPCENCAKRKLSCAYDAKYGRGRPPTPPFSRTSRIGDMAIHTVSALSGVNNREDRPPAHQITLNSADTSIGSSNQNLQETEIEDQYFDPTSGLNFLHRAWRKLSTQRWQGDLDGVNDSDRRQSLESAGDRPLHADVNDIDISSFACIPQESATLELLEFYFETCVVTYRMLHRPTTEAWMNAFLKDRRNNQPIGHSLGNARSSILLAIMAIATLRYEKVYGNMSPESEVGVLVQSDRLFCMSAKLTEAETGFPRLESAQARLLQVLYLLQTSRMNKGWYTFGNTCSITLSLGMHRKRECQRDVSFASRRLGYISLQCYKRTFWVAYTIDRYLSVVFGRPKLYQDEDIDQELPETVNDEDMTNQGISLSEDSGDCLVEGLIFHARYAVNNIMQWQAY